jgi:hypothetical protein
MSEANKPSATTTRTDEDQVPDLPVANDEAVKGGLNYTKIVITYAP